MGNFLASPRTDETGSEGGFRCEKHSLEYAVSSIQGWRTSMEDTHFHYDSLPENEASNSPKYENISFFAVFDGHGGDSASKFCANHALRELQNLAEYKELATAQDKSQSLKVCLERLFPHIDNLMFTHPEMGKDISGTTAISAILTPDSIIFANVGDSRGIYVRGGKVQFFTKDHKPTNPEESKRILNAGGIVRMRRVNGDLAVSRALGDRTYKSNNHLAYTQQLVTPIPDVTVLKRDDNLDEFFLLACDGVWDVMSNDEVCEFVLNKMKLGYSVRQVCQALVQACVKSRDNVSVLIVALPGAPKTIGTLRPEEVNVNSLTNEDTVDVHETRDQAS